MRRCNLLPRRSLVGLGCIFRLTFCFSCVSSSPYIQQNIPNQVELRDSSAHQFDSVNVTAEGGELVVYGTIRHIHLVCESAVHVDLSLVSPAGEAAYFVSIPVVRRSSRAGGWLGAAFRARVPVRVPRDHVVRLVFHGENCVTEQTFDCRAE